MLCDTYVTSSENVYHPQERALRPRLDCRPWTGSTGHMHTCPLLVNAGAGGPCLVAPAGAAQRLHARADPDACPILGCYMNRSHALTSRRKG